MCSSIGAWSPNEGNSRKLRMSLEGGRSYYDVIRRLLIGLKEEDR